MPAEREQLLRDYRAYDRAVDIVSVFEVYFTAVAEMAATVRHFERFPRYDGPDGEPVTPDFSVFFNDDTMLVGELSRLALPEESRNELTTQIGRYDQLREGPCGGMKGGGHHLCPVKAVDVLLLMPDDVANAACDRIAGAIEDKNHPYFPSRRPSILAWSFDPDSGAYTFKYDDRAGNPRPPARDRSPGLEEWLKTNADTLRGMPEHFLPIKTARRFMNDRAPAIYMATILWLEVLPRLAPGIPPVDIDIKAAEVADWIRTNLGGGDADMVARACEFLVRAGLAVPRQDGWRIGLMEIASSQEDVHQELVRRYLSKPAGPATKAAREKLREAEERRVEAENAGERDQLGLEEPEEPA